MRCIVFSRQLVKKEKLSKKDVDAIVRGCRKNIFTKIKGEDLPSDSSLVKIYTTTVDGARRIVLLLDEKTKTVFFLFFRGKEDSIGKNVSVKNPKFRETLKKYLRILNMDVEKDNFEICEI